MTSSTKTTRTLVAGATATAAVALLGFAGPASATLVHSGDSTIDGGLCVGFDCSNNEPMGFVTIKIEENNLRIGAADSSSIAGFPTTDWQIEFNSSSSGGDSYFKIRDCGNSGVAGSVSSTCGGTSMFTIEGGADNDSIYVESSGNQGGNVGLGTTNPGVDLDILSGNTPTMRLQQDTSSGFTAQSWDVAGNESNFFIRDVTNGSTLPFRIEPGTASNTLYLDNNERVGVGTSAPEQTVHVRRTDDAQILVENTTDTLGTGRIQVQLESDGVAQIALLDTRNEASDWRVQNFDDDFNITKAGTGAVEFGIDGSGNVTVRGTLVTGGGGFCDGTTCDGVFDPAVYTVPSIEEHAALMWSNKHLPAVGPTRPGEPINVPVKLTRILNELEHAHIYIEELNEELKEQRAEIDVLKVRLAD